MGIEPVDKSHISNSNRFFFGGHFGESSPTWNDLRKKHDG